MIGPARCEQGDEAVLLDLIFIKIHTKALVETEASDCFMAFEFRAKLPDSCIQAKLEVLGASEMLPLKSTTTKCC